MSGLRQFHFAAPMRVLFAALILGGCVSGPKYGTIKSTITPVAAEQARLTIYRVSAFTGLGFNVRVKFDSVTTGYLHSGTVFSVDHAPGPLHLSIDSPEGRGETLLDVTLEPGRELFVEVAPETSYLAYAGGALPYLLSEGSQKGAHCDDGWCVRVLEPAVARPQLEKLTYIKPDPRYPW